MKVNTTTMESSIEMPQKAKDRNALWSSDTAPGHTVPRGIQSGYNRDTCTPMSITALFTIAKLWKPPRCPTTEEWITKMWYIYTMEFYSAIRKSDMCLKVNGCNWRT
jgi:hypothetical protein